MDEVMMSPPSVLLSVLCLQAAAIYFSKEPKSQDALHGRSAMLRCEVSGPADVRYSWLHNDEPVLDSERRFQEGNNLKFTAVDRNLDAGSFQCVATDAATGEEARSNNASFNIKCKKMTKLNVCMLGSTTTVSCSSKDFYLLPELTAAEAPLFSLCIKYSGENAFPSSSVTEYVW